MEDILQGKTLVALGDSLFEGNKLGNEVTWINKLGKKHNMTVYNHGKNGNPVARFPDMKGKPMCERYADMEDGADYVVVIGGANDHNHDVPIGENDSTDTMTFKGALNVLIRGLLAKYPRARFLFMTNYHRKSTEKRNAAGLTEIDYVLAMEEVCHLYGLPCFNNYYNSGISFQNEAQRPWLDEGVSLGIGQNNHFSDEGYNRLLPLYESLLMRL